MEPKGLGSDGAQFARGAAYLQAQGSAAWRTAYGADPMTPLIILGPQTLAVKVHVTAMTKIFAARSSADTPKLTTALRSFRAARINSSAMMRLGT